jgi:uncharacterized protein YlbG (UPF0298 family)
MTSMKEVKQTNKISKIFYELNKAKKYASFIYTDEEAANLVTGSLNELEKLLKEVLGTE